MFARIIRLLSLLTFLLPFNLYADDSPKKFNIGFGSYALIVAYDSPFAIDDELSGTAFNASYAISDNIAIRGNFYSLTHDDLSLIDAKGTDFVILFGTGLENTKFKAYLGAGIFNESWEALGFDKSFSGIQFNGGIGYNWDVLAIDLMIGVRDSEDYDSFTGLDSVAVSSNLSLSVRF